MAQMPSVECEAMVCISWFFNTNCLTETRDREPLRGVSRAAVANLKLAGLAKVMEEKPSHRIDDRPTRQSRG